MAEHLVLIFVEEFMVMWQWMLKMWHTTHDNFLRTYLSLDVDSSITCCNGTNSQPGSWL